MIGNPKSLTAVVHVKFHYGEAPIRPADKSELEVLASLLDKVSEMDPALQELVIKFCDQVKQTGERAEHKN